MNDSVNVDQKKSLVKRQACFLPLTNEEIDGLVALWTEVRYTANDVIVREGDLVDSVFLIVEGTADVKLTTIKDRSAQLKTVAILNPGDAIGLNNTGFYSLSGKRTATVVAATDIILLKMSVAEFHGFALAHSHVSETMRRTSDNKSTDL